MTPLGALIILSTVIVVLAAGSRRIACIALVGGAMFVTQGQGVNVAGFSFFSTRIFEVAAVCRIAGRGEFSIGRMTLVDKLMLVLYGYSAVVFCLRTSEGVVNHVAVCMDCVLAYGIFRCLVRGFEDLRWLLRAMPFLLVPYALMVLVERHSGVSLWNGMGGLETAAGWTRGDRLRCQGSFRHPSLLGSLGASMFPLYVAMFWTRDDRKRMWLGIAASVALVWASNSGGPASFAGIGLVGWLMWRIRSKMRFVRRGLVALFIALAVTMKAPVWYVLERVSDVTGGDGWHRSELIDLAIQNLGHWWLWGLNLSSTADWFPYMLASGEADICDQFVMLGLNAGIVCVVLFVVLLVVLFKQVGRALAEVREHPQRHPPYAEYFVWGLGVMLAGHIFNWFGITYFDQMNFIWSLQLAAIVSVCAEVRSREGAADPEEIPEAVGIPDPRAQPHGFAP